MGSWPQGCPNKKRERKGWGSKTFPKKVIGGTRLFDTPEQFQSNFWQLNKVFFLYFYMVYIIFTKISGYAVTPTANIVCFFLSRPEQQYFTYLCQYFTDLWLIRGSSVKIFSNRIKRTHTDSLVILYTSLNVPSRTYGMALQQISIRQYTEAPDRRCSSNRCSYRFRNIHRKTPVFESFLNKVAGLETCNFI